MSGAQRRKAKAKAKASTDAATAVITVAGTPAAAAAAAAAAVTREATIHRLLLQRMDSVPVLSIVAAYLVHELLYLSPDIELRASAGAGNGFFATADIPAGTVVCRERGLVSRSWTESQRIDAVDDLALQALDSPDCADVHFSHQLSARKCPRANVSPAAWAKIRSQVSTNAFEVQLTNRASERYGKLPGATNEAPHATGPDSQNEFSGRSILAMRPFACRFNHSCWPNCGGMTADLGSQTDHIVYTVSAVKAGDELAISYFTELAVATDAKRASDLLASHQFACVCVRCSKRVAFPIDTGLPALINSDRNPMTDKMGRLMNDSFDRFVDYNSPVHSVETFAKYLNQLWGWQQAWKSYVHADNWRMWQSTRAIVQVLLNIHSTSAGAFAQVRARCAWVDAACGAYLTKLDAYYPLYDMDKRAMYNSLNALTGAKQWLVLAPDVSARLRATGLHLDELEAALVQAANDIDSTPAATAAG